MSNSEINCSTQLNYYTSRHLDATSSEKRLKDTSNGSFSKILGIIHTLLARLEGAFQTKAKLLNFGSEYNNLDLNPFIEKLGEEVPNWQAGLNHLKNKKGQFLGDSNVELTLHLLKEKHIEFDFIQTPRVGNIINTPSAGLNTYLNGVSYFENSLKKDENSIKKIAIPFDNNGHIIMIFIDLESKRIEYYDSKGASSSSSSSQRYRNIEYYRQNSKTPYKVENLLLSQELRSIHSQLEKLTDQPFKIIENRAQHQENCWSCSIYVSRYVSERLNGNSAEIISMTPFGNSAIIEYQKKLAKETEKRLIEKVIQETNQLSNEHNSIFEEIICD